MRYHTVHPVYHQKHPHRFRITTICGSLQCISILSTLCINIRPVIQKEPYSFKIATTCCSLQYACNTSAYFSPFAFNIRSIIQKDLWCLLLSGAPDRIVGCVFPCLLGGSAHQEGANIALKPQLGTSVFFWCLRQDIHYYSHSCHYVLQLAMHLLLPI